MEEQHRPGPAHQGQGALMTTWYVEGLGRTGKLLCSDVLTCRLVKFANTGLELKAGCIKQLSQSRVFSQCVLRQ